MLHYSKNPGGSPGYYSSGIFPHISGKQWDTKPSRKYCDFYENVGTSDK
jgi:hypothetical protein